MKRVHESILLLIAVLAAVVVAASVGGFTTSWRSRGAGVPATGDVAAESAPIKNHPVEFVLSRDGTQYVVRRSSGIVQLCDAQTDAPLESLVYGESRVRTVALCGDDFVAAGYDDGALVLWDRTTQDSRPHLLHRYGASLTASEISSGGTLLAVGTEHGVVEVWDVKRRRSLRREQMNNRLVRCVRFSPAGIRLLVAGNQPTIQILDLSPQACRFNLAGHAMGVLCAQFSPDGNRVVSGGQDGVVRVVNLTTSAEIVRIDRRGGPILSVAFSDSSEWIAFGGTSGAIEVWDVESNTAAAAFSLPGVCQQVRFAESDSTLWCAVTGREQVVRFWTGDIAATKDVQ